MASERQEAIEKRPIEAVTFLLEVTATRMNQNFTLSGLSYKVVKQPLKDNSASIAVLEHKGGAMYAKLANTNGVKFLSEDEAKVKGNGKKPKAW